MISMKEAIRYPYDSLQRGTNGREVDSCALSKGSIGVGGLILLAFGVALFVWMYPELKRYLRIRSM